MPQSPIIKIKRALTPDSDEEEVIPLTPVNKKIKDKGKEI